MSDAFDPDPLLPAVNEAYGSLNVTREYNIEHYIAGNAYRLTANHGRIKIVQVAKDEVLPKQEPGWTRVCIEDDYTTIVLREKGDDAKIMEKLNAQWKVSVLGNEDQLKQFNKEIDPHRSTIDRKVEMAERDLKRQGLLAEDDQAGIKEALRIAEQGTTPTARSKKKPSSTAIAVPPQGPNKENDTNHQSSLDKLTKWILFSAVSAMNGNVGQSNYTAGNCQLDTFTWQSRQMHPNSVDTTLMWGAVADIGMRWKAFASQDFLAGTTNLFTVEDASKILHLTAIKDAPVEWVAAALFDMGIGGQQSQGGGFIDMGIDCQRDSVLEAFGWTDDTVKRTNWGTGAESWFCMIDDDFELFEEATQSAQIGGEVPSATDQEEYTGENRYSNEPDSLIDQPDDAMESLEVGTRVELTGWKTRTEMNGVRGTLLKQLKDCKCRVRLDDHGEKYVSRKYLKPLAPSSDDADNLTSSAEVNSTSEETTRGCTADSQWDVLAVGDRARICDPQVVLEVRDQTGTLVMKTNSGKWWLKLDSTGKDKLFTAQQLTKLDSKELTSLQTPTKPAAATDAHMMGFLKCARPEWKESQIASVIEKFARIGIEKITDLLIHLETPGGKALNDALKSAGEKSFTAETLRALKEQAEKQSFLAQDDSQDGQEDQLKGFLTHARTDWSQHDVASAVEKLHKIEIENISSLLALLHVKGINSMNERLKDAGEKTFTTETMNALRQCAMTHQ